MTDLADRPNVLIIIMDDLAWGDLGCHGNPHTRTPRLDRLHDESTRLSRYCSGPVCTPARAALMTGRYPYRTGAIDTYLGRSNLHHEETTLAELLRWAGYATGIFGKWHLGDCYPMRAMDRGFDEAVVHNGGGLCQPANFGHDDYFNPELMHNGRPQRYDGYCTDIFTDQAMAWVERQAGGERPWFCYLATNAPHSPMRVDDRWARPHLDAGLPEVWARLYGMVENIDHNVGRMLDRLEALGAADHTLVLYTSDHGPCGSARDDQRRSRFNAGLRDIKGTVYEGGVRVPCFWRWPGRFDPDRELDRIANPVDIMPTLADACGFEPPADRAIDGVSLMPLLGGTTAPADWPDRHVFVQWHRGDEPVRYRKAAAIGQHYKWVRPDEHEPDELYDLEADCGETRDLAGDLPDVVERMRGAYDAWFDDVCGDRPDNFAPPRITIGTDHEPTTVLTRQDWRLYPGLGEAWDTEHPGYWPITVAEAGRYRARVSVPNRGRATLHVRVGQVERTAHVGGNWGEPEASRWFYDLPLEAGDVDFEAWFTEDGREQRLGVWNVFIERAEG